MNASKDLDTMATVATQASRDKPVLFMREDLKQVADAIPHACFHSYRSSNGTKEIVKNHSTGKPPGPDRPPLSDPRANAEVEKDWSDAEKIYPSDWTKYSEFNTELHNLAHSHPGVSQFLLLGMGAPYHKKYGTKAVRQYVLAHRIISSYLVKLAAYWETTSREGEATQYYNPQVVFDSSLWIEEDVNFLKEKFDNMHLSCIISHGQLGHILQTVHIPNVFVITFQPNNPVREMIADCVSQSMDASPYAIICTPMNFEPPSVDTTYYEPDRMSQHVEKLLNDYDNSDIMILHEITPKLPSALFVHKKVRWQREGAHVPEGVDSGGVTAVSFVETNTLRSYVLVSPP